MFIVMWFSVTSLFHKQQDTREEPAMTFPDSTLDQTQSRGACNDTTGFEAGTDKILDYFQWKVYDTVV